MTVFAAANDIFFFDVGFEVVGYSRFKIVALFDQIADGKNVLESLGKLKVALVDKLLQIGIHFLVGVDCLELAKWRWGSGHSWSKVKALMNTRQGLFVELLKESFGFNRDHPLKSSHDDRSFTSVEAVCVLEGQPEQHIASDRPAVDAFYLRIGTDRLLD